MRRLYFFEIFAVLNLGAIALLAHWTRPIVGSILGYILSFSLGIALQALVGIGVRSLIALVRRDRAYFRIICRRQWIVDTIRLCFAGGIVVTAYGWIKLVIPIVHPRLFDQELWDLDQMLFFGHAPTVFFLDLFGSGPFLRFIDWSYANIFFASASLAFAYFLSDPSRRVRIAFSSGNALLWISGAWLYMFFPSVGPAFRFNEIWMPHAESLRVTQTMQPLLMRNFQNVIRAAQGIPVTENIRIVLGVAAFPSLHVAFQTFVFLWMRKLWTAGEVLFGIFVLVIFLGSMITGWHYMIDGVAGMAMAYVCYRIFWRRARLDRWLELRKR